MSCTSSSATLLTSTSASGLEAGAFSNVFRVGKKASSTTSWFDLEGHTSYQLTNYRSLLTAFLSLINSIKVLSYY